MHNRNGLNLPLQPRDDGDDGIVQRVEQLEGDINRIIESADRANSEAAIELARLEAIQNEQESELKSAKRSANVLGTAVAVLSAGLIATFAYSYVLLQKSGSLAAQLPGLQETVNSVGDRIDSAEEYLRGAASQRDVLSGRLINLEKRIDTNLQAARKETEQAAVRFNQAVRGEMQRRLEPVLARLTQVESGQKAEDARVDRLRAEVGDLRKETDRKIALARQESAKGIADVSDEIAGSKRGLDVLSRQIGHSRVDFEAVKDQRHELAPGISLRVTHTNPGYQTLDGRLQLLPEAKTLWVRGQDISEPLVFFTKRDDRPYELIFTRISNDAVVGYLLVPVETASAESDSASVGSGLQMSYALPAR